VLAELSKLQDRIEPFSTQEARAIVEAELKAPIDDIFSEFSDKPVAAASLAQVEPDLMGGCVHCRLLRLQWLCLLCLFHCVHTHTHHHHDHQ
jgi:ABC1 atypical kinase-like domain